MGITYCNLPKCYGTRFVNHRKHGFSKFIHLWPAFITIYQNASVHQMPKQEQRYQPYSNDVRELLQVEAFLDILELFCVFFSVQEKGSFTM